MNNLLLFSIISYVSFQLIANVAALKIGIVCGYAVDMGVFLYPLTFTLRDLIHRELGKKLTKKVIVYTALFNFLMVLYFYFISIFPTELSTSTSATFDKTMSPIWRVVIFSILAQYVSEMVDTEIYQLFVRRFKDRYKWGRVLLSNSISIPIDNLIFCVGAFAFDYSWEVVLQIFLFNFVVKYLFSLLGMPLIYLAKSDKL
ncbi:MAG: queuosine precursor transporter [Bdellovibrionota bacterium]|jgi:uncharacterized integral membrane protein (TIGR00697 family)